MDWNVKSVVVTGGGSGIGKGLCKRFAAEGARVLVSDVDAAAAEKVAAQIGGEAQVCDVRDEAQIKALVETAESRFGGLDLFCSNAGVGFGNRGPLATSASNEIWQSCWDIHVMSHVYAARAALPGMIERGGGFFLQTASAAGLLTQVGDAAYSTTKHAAIGFAESLAVSHGDQNIHVSALCPQYIATAMIGSDFDQDGDDGDDLPPGVLTPAVVAESVLQGLAKREFLILPHPEVRDYFQKKAENYDRWLGGMRKINRAVVGDQGIDFSTLHKSV